MAEFTKPNLTSPIMLKPTMPVGPLRDTVIFPGNSVPIISGRAKSKASLDIAWNSDKLIVFVPQRILRLKILSKKIYIE